MNLSWPVRGLTALTLILAAGIAVADEGVGGWPDEPLPVDPLPEPVGDPPFIPVPQDGDIFIDFGCIDCNLPPIEDTGDGDGDGDSGEEDWSGEDGEEDWDSEEDGEDWSDEDSGEDTGEDSDEDGTVEDTGDGTADGDPGDGPVYTMDGAPRGGDGEIAPNERGPVMMPTSACGGCEAEGGLAPAAFGDERPAARAPDTRPQGNICTDPVTYAALLCAWQGFERP